MPTSRHDEIAERIITCEGLTFALACRVAKEIPEARAMLKDAICKALASEFSRGAEVQRRASQSNALMDELERAFADDPISSERSG